MQIAIIEAFQHQEIVYRWADMLAEQSHRIDFYTEEVLYRDCPPRLHSASNIGWYRRPDHLSWPAFLRQECARLAACDAIILLTTALEYDWFTGLPDEPVIILCVHSPNALVDRPQLLPRPRAWLSYLLRRRGRARNQLLRQIDALASPTPALVDALTVLGLPQILLPYSFSAGNWPLPPPTDRMTLVVPGTVQQNGRDYLTLARALRQCKIPAGLTLEVVLLGRVKDQELASQFVAGLKPVGVEVRTFDQPVPAATFEAIMVNAHGIIVPLLPYYHYGPFREENARISGALDDMVYYGRPGLVPHFYQLTEPQAALAQTYTAAADLSNKLSGWIVQRTYQQQYVNALPTLRLYNKEAVAKAWLQAIEQVI